jgi:hypothetical protein
MITSEAADAGQWSTVLEQDVTVFRVVVQTVEVIREANEVIVLVVLWLKYGGLVADTVAVGVIKPDEVVVLWKKIPPGVLEEDAET